MIDYDKILEENEEYKQAYKDLLEQNRTLKAQLEKLQTLTDAQKNLIKLMLED